LPLAKEVKVKALVVYDSVYGNTETIAKAIGGALLGDIQVRRAREISPPDLHSVDLLVVGSPTQAGRPIAPVQNFLKTLPDLNASVSVAAFDTRSPARFAAIFGYAAKRIANALKEHGGRLVAPPEGFFVDGKTGPLKDGETQRAAEWATAISAGRAPGK
jgi:flavodoxin I